VIILNKSKYLAVRDFNKYKELIKAHNIKCVHNDYMVKAICFWDETHWNSQMK